MKPEFHSSTRCEGSPAVESLPGVCETLSRKGCWNQTLLELVCDFEKSCVLFWSLSDLFSLSSEDNALLTDLARMTYYCFFPSLELIKMIVLFEFVEEAVCALNLLLSPHTQP